MTDDLVQRLRRTYRKEYAPTRSMCGDNSNKPFPFPILATEVPVNPDGHEAADQIEADGQRIAELEAALRPVIDWYQSDEMEPRPIADIVADIVSDLQHDRFIALKMPALLKAADHLSVCAQTSGGTAGRDDGLVDAISDYSKIRAALQETSDGQ